MMTQLINVSGVALQLGLKLEVAFLSSGSSLVLPFFRRADDEA
jgi:hypothetical protein